MNKKWVAGGSISALLFLGFVGVAAAGTGGESNLGTVAYTITKSFYNLALLITALAYISGLAFAIGAVLKFKQHKDNPTQIPIGGPIALSIIAASLVFFPTVLGFTGTTFFAGEEETAGPYGIIFERGQGGPER